MARARMSFLMFLVGSYYFMQGMGGNPGVHSQALKKVFRDSGYSPTEAAGFFSLMMIPWMIKPIYGIISDFLPIFGTRRKSYFILSGILAVASFLSLSFLDIPTEGIWIVLLVANFGFAFSDVLADAVMLEKGQPLNATDRLQSAQWAAIGAASIIVAFSKGYIAEYLTLSQSLLISAIFPVLMIIFTLFFLEEERVKSPGEVAREAWQGLKTALKSSTIWAAAIFLFVFRCTPNTSSVFYYYETDVLGFSDVLVGQIDTAGSVAFLIGVLLFALIAKKISHETLLRGIVITGAATTLMYIWFVDYFSGYIVSAIANAVYAWAFIGCLTIAAKVCPKKAEATVFALLMSFLNFGDSLGGIFGGKLYEIYGYNTMVIASTILIAATWFLIPLARIKKDPVDTA